MIGRYRTVIRKAAIAGYAAYKWLEAHADEVEEWADKVAGRASGTKAERVVVPPARGAARVARWVQDQTNDDHAGSKRKPTR